MSNQVSQDGGIGSTNNQTVNIYQSPNYQKAPSVIANLVRTLAEMNTGAEGQTENVCDDFQTYDIAGKLEHNHVIKYRPFIEAYAEYMMLVDSGYDAVASAAPNAKSLVLKIINNEYRKLSGELIETNRQANQEIVSNIDIIRTNSDSIIDSVITEICRRCDESMRNQELYCEEIEINVSYIVFHAFVECKVLEKPTS